MRIILLTSLLTHAVITAASGKDTTKAQATATSTPRTSPSTPTPTPSPIFYETTTCSNVATITASVTSIWYEQSCTVIPHTTVVETLNWETGCATYVTSRYTTISA
ncbi:hypothetical protein BCR34DRAFT_582492 [Clohesyomyces aquaticus]|uniref:Uncharacterized protein n=1 Tax=Clohesyomyces aquaticus TaxID=1231657 RepID=A0A1Y2A8S9_9PLEO|nr:hypothetical protein BCR34DRAFT_582492 [Clohesyomyces aquaticus]